jgi:hypothetical protein
MSLLIPSTMPANSYWKNTIIVNSTSTTGLTLTVTSSNVAVTCALNTVLAAIAQADDEERFRAPHKKRQPVPEGRL